MFRKPSLLTRISVAKLVGFAFGLAGFFMLPAFGVDDLKLRLGVLFWYTTVGALIGLAGVMTFHPILRMRMPWWLIGPGLGAWMNFVLILIAWNVIAPLTAEAAFFGLTSPWWVLAEGAIVGFVIGGGATYFGGEGPETARTVQRVTL